MTFQELKQFNNLKLLKETLEIENDICISINAVDTTKIPVSSGKISDITADTAIRIAQAEEYNSVCKRINEIYRYLLNIKDTEVKAIAYAYFIQNKTFYEIGEALHCDRRTVSRKLLKYIAHNAH